MAKQEVAPSSDSIELAILGEGDYKVPVEDANQTAREIVYRILDAKDEAELFEQGGATSARDLLNVPLIIKGVRWQSSKYSEEGPTVYALVSAERLDLAEDVLITCGSRNVMAQLFQAGKLGLFPLTVPKKIIENETSGGFGALWLVNA
jgi:hypothetical protein